MARRETRPVRWQVPCPCCSPRTRPLTAARSLSRVDDPSHSRSPPPPITGCGATWQARVTSFGLVARSPQRASTSGTEEVRNPWMEKATHLAIYIRPGPHHRGRAVRACAPEGQVSHIQTTRRNTATPRYRQSRRTRIKMEGECLCKGRSKSRCSRVKLRGSRPSCTLPRPVNQPHGLADRRPAVKVRINDDELFFRRRGNLCHCANCRKVAGGICKGRRLLEVGPS